MNRALVLLLLLVAFPAQAEVSFDWVTVGGPGNACDPGDEGCFGSVADAYRISKFEVTNTQYAEFLNAVAATDTKSLYDTNMGSGPPGGITRSGTSGSFTYSAVAGRENMPVVWVSFFDSLRFANWLHNGQLTGAQNTMTTEDGAYEMFVAGSIVRAAGASVFLTSEDEWYKATYYDTGSMSYFSYPAGSNSQTTCTTPGATANTANCANAEGDLTNVGSYIGAPSPIGTYDQGGNVFEWTEAIIDGSCVGGACRLVRGGGYPLSALALRSDLRSEFSPALALAYLGFRVASPVPAPAVPTLGTLGMALLGSLLGFVSWRRLRA